MCSNRIENKNQRSGINGALIYEYEFINYMTSREYQDFKILSEKCKYINDLGLGSGITDIIIPRNDKIT